MTFCSATCSLFAVDITVFVECFMFYGSSALPGRVNMTCLFDFFYLIWGFETSTDFGVLGSLWLSCLTWVLSVISVTASHQWCLLLRLFQFYWFLKHLEANSPNPVVWAIFKWEQVEGIIKQNHCRPSCNLRKSHLVKETLKQQGVITVKQTSFSIALIFNGSECN